MSQSRETNLAMPTRYGTFGGVFTPCTLTIMGVIMFLRTGQVVGQAGFVFALVIVICSKLITTLTSLSLSATATNTRVEAGGAYYLISRSLGVEFGGAIGLLFFFAQAISVSMYSLGFAEAFSLTIGSDYLSIPMLASIVNVFVFIAVYLGAGWAIRIQYFVLAALVLSLVSFFVGAVPTFSLDHLQANLKPEYVGGASFFTMFALFFPAVTGIMAGANMSGDLKSPERSIPRGTLMSVMVTGVLYLILVVVLAGTCSRSELLNDNMVMQAVSAVPMLIIVGIFAATLSSALGSMMGAPRILQAFARDEIFAFMKPLGKGHGANNEPRNAAILTFAIAQGCVLLGDLDAIAPVITMAFMLTYATLNMATFYESITRNPSYRPRFRYSHWSFSLLGAIGCLAVMFLIDPLWAFVSLLAVLGLHTFISKHEIEARWGDMRSGLVFERTRQNLLKLEEELDHPKNWRPIILAMSGQAWTRPHLAIYGHWLSAGHGVLTLAQVIHGEVENRLERRRNQEGILRKFIHEQELQAFPAVVVAPYLSDGIESLVQCQGLGGLRPNTVLIGWPNDVSRAEAFVSSLKVISELGVSVLVMRQLETEGADNPWHVSNGTIDVWWRGMKNGEMMLLLAHMLILNPEWRARKIRLLRIIPKEQGQEEVLQHMQDLLRTSRIEAEPQVIISEDIPQAIQETSRNSSLTLIGIMTPEQEGKEQQFFENVEHLVGNLPRVLFVNSAGGMKLES